MINRIAIIVKGIDNTKKENSNALKFGLHINKAIGTDTDRMIEFIKKPMFGNWQPEEIAIVSNDVTPMKQQIEMAIPQNASFVFFYYMGHGNSDENENVLMQFKCDDVNAEPADNLFVRELEIMLNEKNVSNYLVIPNCCRTSAETEPVNLKLYEFPLDIFDNYKIDVIQTQFKDIFNQKVIVYTTLKNRKSLYGYTGNVFTESFFRSLYHWLGLPNRNEVLLIKDLIDLTNIEMEKHGGQKAEIENYKKDGNFIIPICLWPLAKKSTS